MRFTFTLVITFILTVTLKAQNISNYTFTTGANESLVNMSSGTTTLIGANQGLVSSAVTNIGFDFFYVGTYYSQFSANANGVIRFGPVAVATFGNTYNIAGNARVVALGAYNLTAADQMATHSTGKVHYKVIGSAPDRILVVEWLNMEIISTSTTADGTFQIKIYESAPGSTNPGRIDMIYGSMYNSTGTQFWTGIGIGSGSTQYQGINTSLPTPTSTLGSNARNTYTTGATITDLSSASDGSRRYYSYNNSGNPPNGTPDDLTVTCVSSTTATLTWTGTVTNETGYVLYRSDDGGTTYNYLTNTSTAQNLYQDSGLTPNTTYYYRIYFVTEGVLSGLSGTGQTNTTTLASGSSVYAIASGNWNSTSTWSSGAVPTSSNDVIIGCGGNFDVTVNTTTAAVNNLTIESDGELYFNSGQTLTVSGSINNSGSIDIDGGTLNIGGDLNNTATGTIDEGTTSTVSFNGSSTSNMTNLNPNASTSQVSNTTTGSVSIADGPGNVNNGGGNNIPNPGDLTGCANCASMSVTMPAASGTYTALESISLNITHTWNSDLNIYLLSPDNTVLLLATDKGGSSNGYINITFSDAGISLPSGSTALTDNSTYRTEVGTLASYSGTMAGTWTLYVKDDAGLDTGNLTSFGITLNETANRLKFNNLIVNNTSSTGVVFQCPVNIDGQLTLTDGIVATTSTNILTFEDDATVSGGSAASFIDGPVRKVGDDAFIFPTGDGTIWARIGISAPTSSSTFTAQYFGTSYSNVSSIIAMNNVSSVEYWDLNRDAGSGNVNVTLYSQDYNRSVITDQTDLTVAHFNGSDWEDMTQTAVNGESVTSGVVSSFSPFTFGSNSSTVNNLPVELTSFDAELKGSKVYLDWKTASELNNDFYEIQRSEDGKEFETIGKVEGNGTTNKTESYSFVDPQPFYGKSFYRLRQVDFDGQFKYLPVVDINNINEEISFRSVIYPNPTSQDNINLRILTLNKENKISVQLTDLSGKSFFNKTVNADEFATTKLIKPNTNLKGGIYFLTIKQNQEVIRNKIVIR